LQAETAQVQLDVLGERRVTTGEDEAVATDPGRVLRVVAQYALVERVRQGSQAHRGARVARTALLHGIGGKHAGKVDRPGVLLGPIRREVADHQCLELGREMRIIRHDLRPSSGYDVLGLQLSPLRTRGRGLTMHIQSTGQGETLRSWGSRNFLVVIFDYSRGLDESSPIRLS